MGRTRWHRIGRTWPLMVSASPFVHGALRLQNTSDGWVRPWRFLPEQVRALSSCAAWHPALYKQMASATSGIVVEFLTDAQEVALEVMVDSEPPGTAAQIALAVPEGTDQPFDGISADVEDHHLASVMPPAEPVELIVDLNDGVEDCQLPGMGELRHVRIYLPALRGCQIRSIMADGQIIEPVSARPTFLVLGDSISQGFLVGDPAHTWPMRVAEEQGYDLVNQGVGGLVFQATALQGLGKALNPELVWIALGVNYRFERCTAAEIKREIKSYLKTVAEMWPDVPTFVATPTAFDEEAYPTHQRSAFEVVDQALAAETAVHPQMTLVDGALILEDRRRYLADADHPNMRGARLMALRIGRVILGEPPIDTHAARAERIRARIEAEVQARAQKEAAKVDVEATESAFLDGNGDVPPIDMEPIALDELGSVETGEFAPIAPAATPDSKSITDVTAAAQTDEPRRASVPEVALPTKRKRRSKRKRH